jgi:flagellar hook-length control protein FliK
VRRNLVVLNLDPPIGRVTVRIVQQGGSLRAVVVASGQGAYSVLSQAKDEVMGALSRSGYQVTSLRITQVAVARAAGEGRVGERRRRGWP